LTATSFLLRYVIEPESEFDGVFSPRPKRAKVFSGFSNYTPHSSFSGFGQANVETMTPCTYKTKMRIASISKPITIGLLAKLKEDEDIDIDKAIQEYVPYYGEKKVNGKKVSYKNVSNNILTYLTHSKFHALSVNNLFSVKL